MHFHAMPCRETPEWVPLGLCRVRATPTPSSWGLAPSGVDCCSMPCPAAHPLSLVNREVTLTLCGQGDAGPLPPLPGARGLAARSCGVPHLPLILPSKDPRQGGRGATPAPARACVLRLRPPSSGLGAAGARVAWSSSGTSEHLPRCPVQACMDWTGGALLWPMCRAARLCHTVWLVRSD